MNFSVYSRFCCLMLPTQSSSNKKRCEHGWCKKGFRKVRQSRRCPGAGRIVLVTASHQDYEERLQEFLSQESPQSRERDGVTELGFLVWLASREQEATGQYKERLGTLASQLIALREGLEPAPLEEAGNAGRELTRTEAPHLDLVQLGATWRALTQASAPAALSLEAAQLAERQVSELGAGISESRATSAVELMGRKRLGEGESPPLGPADPAARILEALLAVQDDRERLELLPSAFEPPSEGDLPSQDDEGDEQLYTSPARLVQAIEFALKQMDQRPPVGSQQPAGLLPGNAPSAADVKSVLLVLRKEVFKIWSGLDSDAF